MPFGISPAPEEFQQRLDQALAGLNGCKAIADDILVFGCGANDDEAVRDYDEKVIALLQRCRDKGVKLNRGKAAATYVACFRLAVFSFFAYYFVTA